MKLILILLCFANSLGINSNSKERLKCIACSYAGSIQLVQFEPDYSKCKVVPIQLGQFFLSMEYSKCRLKSKKLSLKGHVISNKPKDGSFFSPVPNVKIFLATRQNDILTVKKLLHITDRKGGFYFSVQMEDDNYIIVKEFDDRGTTYAIRDFKPTEESN